MAATPICTVQDIKALGGITSTANDALLTALLVQCLQAIGAFCNRTFNSRDIIEYRDGNDSTRMLLANYPITAVASLTIDGVSIPPSVNNGPGYWFPQGGRALMLRNYAFTRGQRNVVIDLTAGYGDAAGVAPWPDDLKLALQMYVLTRFNERTRLGIGSKGLAGESITFTDSPSGTSSSSGGIPSAAKDILFNYLNVLPESGQ